jgi:hypothetical protein
MIKTEYENQMEKWLYNKSCGMNKLKRRQIDALPLSGGKQ